MEGWPAEQTEAGNALTRALSAGAKGLTWELVRSQGDVTNVVVALRLVGDQGKLEPRGRVEESLLHATRLAVVQRDRVLLRAPAPEFARDLLGIPRDMKPKLHFDAVARLDHVEVSNGLAGLSVQTFRKLVDLGRIAKRAWPRQQLLDGN